MVKNIIKSLLAVTGILLVLFSCDTGMGMGAPIDFEPPILILDYYPNPYYVNNNTVITGWVYDNTAVSEIIIRDALNNEREFTRAEIDFNKSSFKMIDGLLMQPWYAVIPFRPEDNNEKITAEIIAFDKRGNTGEQSVQFITFMVDLKEPLFKNPVIQRTNTRSAPLQSKNFLENIAAADPNTREIRNVDFLQNGYFWITTEVVENENYAETVKIFLFDNEEIVYTADFDNYNDPVNPGNPFAPRWTINEDNVIAGGDAKGLNYSARKANNERFYLRVRLEATDLALNTGDKVLNNQDQEILIYDYGFLCLYSNADIPKAKRTGGLQDEIPPGTEIPIEIYDDDLIDVAYAELLTLGQFYDYGTNDTERLTAIRNKLIAGETIYNWRKSSLYDYPDTPDMRNIFTNRVVPPGADYESIITMVKTGSNVADCGEFKLVVLVKDKKSDPHPGNYESSWGSYVYDFTVTDNNAALIVIDTTDSTFDSMPGASSGKSPEENTFPGLELGKYFTINGYTLDEFSPEAQDLTGYVDIFRMAWIPHRLVLDHGQDNIVKQVREAMSMQAEDPDSSSEHLYPAGVQRWTLSDETYAPGKDSYFTKGTNHIINGVTYTKQTFKKKFNIFGDEKDDLNTNYYNFHNGTNSGCTGGVHNDGCFENEPKIFVIYVKNRNGLPTYRTIRLLGNKNPPDVKIYDLTNLEIPGLDYSTASDTQIYNSFKGILNNPTVVPNKSMYEMQSFNTFMEMSRLKVFVEAQPADGVEITDVAMYDITNADVIINKEDPLPPGSIGYLNSADKEISFTNELATIGQRVYKFYARNRLGEHVQLQRTVSVSNTARLLSITTPQPAGVYYGKDTVIELSAQFSAPVKVRTATGSTNRPRLNLRYETTGEGNNAWKYTTADFSGDLSGNPGESEASTYLQFYWKVPGDAHGRLQTVDAAMLPANPGGINTHDRPIFLNGASIIDASREEPVFLPGTGVGYSIDWNNNPGNLQGGNQTGYTPSSGKIILLDGIEPVLDRIIIGGKTRYAVDDNTGGRAQWYYFGPSDIITFEITASKSIRNDGRPQIQFNIRQPNGTINPTLFSTTNSLPTDPEPGKPNGGIRFSVNTRDITVDGEIVNIELTNADGAKIIDENFNTLDASSLSSKVTALNYALIVDNTRPPCNNNAHSQEDECAAGAQLRLEGAQPLEFYNYNPIITIVNRATATQEPWGVFTQYSLDGGATYFTLNNPPQVSDPKPDGVTFNPGSPNTITLNSSGANPWRLRVRQVDKAGNISNQSKIYEVEVEANFPSISSLNVIQPRGIYKGGDTLSFTIDFDRNVRAVNASAYIYVSRMDLPNNTDLSNDLPGYTTYSSGVQNIVKVPVNFASSNTWGSTITFIWSINANTKYMDNGIKIAKIVLDGLEDRFGNRGDGIVGSLISIPTSDAGKISISTNSGPVNNITGASHDVLSFRPRLNKTDSRPASGTNITANDNINNANIVLKGNRNELQLYFDRPIYKEIGAIIVKPRANFPIPPVIPAEGGVITASSSETLKSFGDVGEYIHSFFEIFNNPNLTTAQKEALRLERATTTTDAQGKLLTTGQDYGPYKLTTQGLIEGEGYSAENAADTSAIAITTTAGRMIPDTSQKYVLDYQYNINSTTGAVFSIRAALEAAEFRWQRIDVNTSRVTIYKNDTKEEVITSSSPTGGTYVEVSLPYKLPKGMQWEIIFEDDLFVDKGGNVAMIDGTFWFWTEGVQKPVIRVNRTSLDWRNYTSADQSNLTNAGVDNTNFRRLGYNAPAANSGYHINDFNTINFKIESETPGATVKYSNLAGVQGTGGAGQLSHAAVSTNWTGIIGTTTWNNTTLNTNGQWILPNLVRRAVSGRSTTAGQGSNTYWVNQTGVTYTVNGKTMEGTGSYRGFRSYNRDASLSDLTITPASSPGANNIGSITVNTTTGAASGTTPTNLKASKNYVIAQAVVDQGGVEDVESDLGYEGVFVTVVALADGSTGNNPWCLNLSNTTQLYASNNMGDASIAGFPTQLLTNDWRYLKVPFKANNTRVIWITTEIVSQAYYSFSTVQNNGTIGARPYSTRGDAGNFISGGYGELSFSYNQEISF